MEKQNGKLKLLHLLRILNTESDKDHPYGHERIECIFSMILSENLNDSTFLFNRSKSEKPTPAAKNPFNVCSIVSQYGIAA